AFRTAELAARTGDVIAVQTRVRHHLGALQLPAVLRQEINIGIVGIDPDGDLQRLPGQAREIGKLSELLRLWAQDLALKLQVAEPAPVRDGGEAVPGYRALLGPHLQDHRVPRVAPGDACGGQGTPRRADVPAYREVEVVFAEDLDRTALLDRPELGITGIGLYQDTRPHVTD